MKALRFIPTKPYTIFVVDIDSFKRVEEMFIRADGGLSLASYYFPLEAMEPLKSVVDAFKFASLAEETAMKEWYNVRSKF